LARGAIDHAQRAADSLYTAGSGEDREIGAYWRAVCWLYRDYPDSALVILEARDNRWSGGMRGVHAGVLLRLARETSLARSAAYARRDASLKSSHDPDASHKASPDKGLLDRIDALQREAVAQRAEIARLEREKDKFLKLLQDLETIR